MAAGSAVAPLVSCIMPTRDRRSLVARAVMGFLRQDWPHLELIVVDDGDDAVGDVVAVDPRMLYHGVAGRHAIGHKRKLACEMARGDFMAHWDDDDWYPSSR